MHAYSEKFIFKKTGENLSLKNYFSEEGFLNKVGRNLSIKQIIYTGFVKAILYNREINIYFFTIFNYSKLYIFINTPIIGSQHKSSFARNCCIFSDEIKTIIGGIDFYVFNSLFIFMVCLLLFS